VKLLTLPGRPNGDSPAGDGVARDRFSPSRPMSDRFARSLSVFVWVTWTPPASSASDRLPRPMGSGRRCRSLTGRRRHSWPYI